MPDLRSVLFILGPLLAVLAALMLGPALIEIERPDGQWDAFLFASLVTLSAGGTLFLSFRQPQIPTLSVREGFLLTALAWLVLAAFAALPFAFLDLGLSAADAFFEAMSGLTTTGATTITHLAERPPGVLLWRAMLQWVGGIGIIVIGVAILPVLRVGGMQLFRAESSEKIEKARPRVSQIAGLLISVYLVLTLACIVLLSLAGMPLFDALCHAMSTVSTAGFSTHDASIGHYGSTVIELVVIVFMLLGGMTFVLLVRVARGSVAPLWRDQQTRWYLGYIAAFVLLMTLWQVAVNGRDVGTALQSSAFNVVSIATTTGFTTEDYTLWGTLPVGAMIMIFFIGGCTGSTAGGMKVFRFCVLIGVARWQLRHLVHPHRMTPPIYNGRPISDEIVRSVLSFFVFHMACFALLTMALSAFGLDFITSVSGAAQALNNVGPGLGPVIGPSGSYASLPDGAKWLLSIGHLLGRLELLTVLVLLSPTFWRG